MRKTILSNFFLTIAFASSAFAQSNEQLSAACHAKVTKLASAFAEANMPNMGAPTTLGTVTVDSSVTPIAGSGYADGTGAYQMSFKDGNVEETFDLNFRFSLLTGPHCTVVKIEADYK